MPKGIIPGNDFRSPPFLSLSDKRWGEIRRHIPELLSAKADADLYAGVMESCSWFLNEQARFQESINSAAAIRASKKQLAPLERMAKALRAAADAQKEIGKIHDDRLSDISQYDNLEAMAKDAERRLTALRKFEPVNIAAPFPKFVIKIAECCSKVGLTPGITGRVYEDNKPTWFQKFVVAIDKNLLASKNLVWTDRSQNNQQFERDPRALYAEIAKAMRRGDRKRRSRRK
jgi:hypothetical protein